MSSPITGHQMQFISKLSTSADPQQIVQDLIQDETGPYDLGFIFTAYLDKAATEEIIRSLATHLKIRHLIGCSCAGIIGTHDEIENRPAVSLILGKLPEVKITPFAINQIELEQLTTPESWYEFLEVFPTENPVFLTLPDPFMLDMNKFLFDINRAYPKCPVIGGLASGARQPNENVLILDNERYEQGLIGVILTGNLKVETLVSQGCRPIGETFIVTKAQGNIVHEIAGQPLYEVLKNVLFKASARDKLLAQEALFIGIAMDEHRQELKRGDFLIRGLMGIDGKTGAGAISDYVKTGQTIQFHVRDAATATEDLNELLKIQQVKHHEKPKGALVFSCNGRGESLFREKNHDIKVIQQYLGPVPAAGFFCAGEIGPVCKNNYLHGFTSSLALFYSEQ